MLINCVFKEKHGLQRKSLPLGSLIQGRGSFVESYEGYSYEDHNLRTIVRSSCIKIITNKQMQIKYINEIHDELEDLFIYAKDCTPRHVFEKYKDRLNLEHCLNKFRIRLYAEGLLKTNEIRARLHGWLNGFWFTWGIGEQTTAIPGLIFTALHHKVCGSPRIFVHTATGEQTCSPGWKDNTLAVSLTETPQVIEGNAKIPDGTLRLALAWIAQNKTFLLRHWEGEEDSSGLCRNLTKLTLC